MVETESQAAPAGNSEQILLWACVYLYLNNAVVAKTVSRPLSSPPVRLSRRMLHVRLSVVIEPPTRLCKTGHTATVPTETVCAGLATFNPTF